MAALSTFHRAKSPHGSFKPFFKQHRENGMSKEEINDVWQYLQRCEYWVNDTYQVAIDKEPEHGLEGLDLWHLSFKRNDREPFHDWRIAQAIKNALCGPEVEAVEIYPAESRLVDTANQYHLWAVVTPGVRFPFGFTERAVVNSDFIDKFSPGAQQRPFDEEISPNVRP